MITRVRCCLLLSISLFFAVGSFAAEPAPPPGYQVLKKITPGGEGGWDYLTIDPAARRLYIARSDRVMVLDIDKETLVGEVTNSPGVHGVALVPKLNRGFASNGGDSTVSVFDLRTLKEVARIKVGQRPDAILYDPASGRVFTFNAGSRDATAIDAENQKVVGTIKLDGKPEFAATDEKGLIFVNVEDKNEVLAIDAQKLTVEHRWPLSPGEEPTGLAIDRAHRRLFATCHNEKMIILDADSGRVIASPAIGKKTDACVFDPDAGLAFSSNGDGTLTVVREESPGQFAVAENVATEAGARTMALDSKTHRIFLVTARAKQGERRKYEPGSFMILVVGKP